MKRYPIKLLITDTHVKNENQEIIKNIFKQCYDLAVKLDIPIVHMGDFFTYRSSQSLSCLLTILEVLQTAPLNITGIAGNHDKPDLTKTESYLRLYKSLDNFIIHEDVYYECDFETGVVYCYLSYFKEGIVYLEKLLDLIDKVKQNKRALQLKKVLFTHTSINGVRNNDGTCVEGDNELEYFDFFDLVLSGHYHCRQELSESVIYFGSALQANYGEDEHKGFTILYNDLTTEHVQSDFPAYKKLYIDATDKKQATQLLEAYANSEDNVRFIFQGDQAQIESISPSVFNDSKIEVKFENIVEAARDFDDIEEAELMRFDTKSISKYWLEYATKSDLSPEQKTKGLKLLMTTR